MKTKHIALFLVGLMVLATAGCESRLDIEKHGNLGGQDDFYQTDSEVEQALSALYQSWGGSYYTWFLTMNLLSDDAYCGGGSRGDNSDMEKLNEYTFDTDHGYVESIYSSMYSIIYYANLIIEKAAGDTDLQKQYIAEAHFFRAWAHFQLVVLYGTAPVVDHLLSSSEYRQSNSTPEELWAFVESELEEAINSGYMVSKSSADDEETGMHVTKEVAQAMLGKAYVFQEKYSEAATMLDKVINSGLYALYTGDYGLITHAAANNCCEAMLEVQKRDDSEYAWYQYTMTYVMLGWRSDHLNYTGDAADEIASGTYGFFNPRKDAYDAIAAWEGEDGYRLNRTIRTAEQMEEYGVTLISGNSLIGHEGYFCWKTRALQEDCIYDASYFQVLQYINLRVMRYAEVLLLAAEANLQAGNTSKALSYINQVRERAQLDDLTSLTLSDIKSEKQAELYMEGVRFQDLVRWGDAMTVMADQGKEVPSYSSSGEVSITNTNTVYGFKEKHKLLPIPLSEIELNPNMVQNENW